MPAVGLLGLLSFGRSWLHAARSERMTAARCCANDPGSFVCGAVWPALMSGQLRGQMTASRVFRVGHGMSYGTCSHRAWSPSRRELRAMEPAFRGAEDMP